VTLLGEGARGWTRALSERPTLVAAFVYALLMPALWLPVVARTGMAWDTTIVYRSENTSFWHGFVYVGDPLRKFTDFFYQVSYVAGAVLGVKGSWVPFHVVYAILWWARGLLAYMIVARVLPRYRGFALLVGAFAILHGADKQLNLIGQLNQVGMIVWMLLAVYCYVRSLDARRNVAAVVWLSASALSAYLCLWSYEAPLFILALLPAVFLWIRWGWSRRSVALSLGFLVVPGIYAYDNLVRYATGRGGQYQESILKSPITPGPVARDLWLNVGHTVAFWRWGTGLSGYVRPDGAEPVVLGLVEAALLGVAVLVFVRSTRSRIVPPLRTLAASAAVGFGLIIASLPAYVVLESNQQLNRTLFLSSVGTALFLASIALAVPAALRGRRRAGYAVAAATCAAVAFFGLLGAYATGSYFDLIWSRQRDVMAGVLRAAPSVRPGTVVALVDVPSQPNPFGDNMWFDFALRLAYPHVPVAGVYYFADGKPGIGASLELRHGRWVSTGRGFPTLVSDVPVRKTVVIRLTPSGRAKVLDRLPRYLAGDVGPRDTYAPNQALDRSPVSSVARRRYLDP
jgi:hypothetical protein